jgi:hypothetical protein
MNINCDNCGKENPIARECNFCPACREAFHKHSKSEAYRTKREADRFWEDRFNTTPNNSK